MVYAYDPLNLSSHKHTHTHNFIIVAVGVAAVNPKSNFILEGATILRLKRFFSLQHQIKLLSAR
jgi:hypothetical protein